MILKCVNRAWERRVGGGGGGGGGRGALFFVCDEWGMSERRPSQQ